MPTRQRWTPLKGTQNRIYDPWERLLLGLADGAGRLLFAAGRRLRRRRAPGSAAVREVLVLRLDRIGDLVMSLPALFELRAALPGARIRLAVGRWAEDVARLAPVDEVLVWSAPWAGRGSEGALSLAALVRLSRGLSVRAPDLALDLQGDVRAALLMWLTGARRRVGYANTGGAYLLTDVLPIDESVSWVEQNRRAVAHAVGGAAAGAACFPAALADREGGRALLAGIGVAGRSPLVAIHPSGGRAIKQWPIARWNEVARRLQREHSATILITGSLADRALAGEVGRDLPDPALDLTGRLSARETMAVLSCVDLFLSPDTGPMHMACAVGAPSVSVFGPSDPARYFSGGGNPGRHVVVRAELWCSPCNLIRKPPAECARTDAPECLRLVGVDDVMRAAAALLGAEPRASHEPGP
jgi:ADP-heptose:LPS heptosyltransferase